MKMNRLFEMVYILINKKSVTAKVLAEHQFHLLKNAILSQKVIRFEFKGLSFILLKILPL